MEQLWGMMDHLSPVGVMCTGASADNVGRPIADNAWGGWQRIDAEGVPAKLPQDFFLWHPVYRGIQDVVVAGQHFVRIPAFWVKTGTVGGNPCWWLSHEPCEGYHLHPAFVTPHGVQRQVLIGKYYATPTDDGKIGSIPHRGCVISKLMDEFKADMVGHMLNVHELAAIKWLMLIEAGHANMVGFRGVGYNSLTSDSYLHIRWRGIFGLWGRMRQMFDGIQKEPGNNFFQVLKSDGSGQYAQTGWTIPFFDSPGMPSSSTLTMTTDAGDGYDLADLLLPGTFTPDMADSTFPGMCAGKTTTTVQPWFGGVSGTTWTNTDGLGASLFSLNLANAITAGPYNDITSRIAMYGDGSYETP
jgi:hypothetical protein